MNAILHDLGQLVESVYLPLLALNAVALIVSYTVGYAGCRRGAKWILGGMLCLNTPVVLFILGAIVREAIAASQREGAERGMAVGMLVPVVNVGILAYFASATWPIQAEAAALRAQVGVANEEDARALLSAALRLEMRGQPRRAMATYEEVIRRFPSSEPGKDADASLRSLRAKLGRS